MDLFILITLILSFFWSIIYLYKSITKLFKYKLALFNFIISIIAIFIINNVVKGLWKFPIMQWFLFPNIFAGTIFPLIFLIVYYTLKTHIEYKKKN